MSDRVAIIGAGIGGLAAAVAMKRAGLETIVIEKAPVLQELGAGLYIWSHSRRTLAELGLEERVAAESINVEVGEFTDARGHPLLHVEVGVIAREHGDQPPLCVGRPQLHRCLTQALDESVFRLGAEAVELEQDDGGVTIRLADGSEERAAVVVGADGGNSWVRSQILGPVERRYGGQGWRCLAPVEEGFYPPNLYQQMWGRGLRFGLTLTKSGELYWFAPGNAPEDYVGGGKQEVLDLYKDWPELVTSTIAATPERAFTLSKVYDFAPLDRWSKGRVTLLGDAAHATTPGQGRGASEAINDGVSLARVLVEADDLSDQRRVEAALADYEQRRRAPTATVTRRSRRITRMGSITNPAFCALRNGIFSAAPDKLGEKIFYIADPVDTLPTRESQPTVSVSPGGG